MTSSGSHSDATVSSAADANTAHSTPPPSTLMLSSSTAPDTLIPTASSSGRSDTALATATASTTASTTLSPMVGSHVPFLPLSPSSSRRVPPSPSESSSVSVSSFPVVVFRPPHCDSVVLFDPSAQQLTLYERRAAGRGASNMRPPQPLYLPSSSPRSASPSPSSSPAAVGGVSARQWRKRTLDGSSKSLTSRSGAERGSGCDVCPLCRQPLSQSLPSGRRSTFRRYSDSAAVADQQTGTDSSRDGSSRTLQYTVTELEDDTDQQSEQSPHSHYEQQDSPRDEESASDGRESAQSAEAVVGAEEAMSDSGGVVGGLAPFTSPDYFSLLSYTFLREQRQRQKQRRAARMAPRSLIASQRLAIDDGTTATTQHTSHQQQWTAHWHSPQQQQQQQQVAIDGSEQDNTDALEPAELGLSVGPARLLPALLPSAVTEYGAAADSDNGVDDMSPDGRPLCPSFSSAAALSSSSDSVGGGSGGMAGLQSSSFVTGYYDRFFVRVRKLGSGTYGAVYLTCHMLEGVELGHYACKIIPVGDSKSWLQRVVSEVRALESVHHRHVVSYRHSWLEMAQVADFGPAVPCLFLLMQYCDLGTVAQLVWPANSKSSSRDGRAYDRHSDSEPHSPQLGVSESATAGDEQRQRIERIRAQRRRERREEVSEEQKDSASPLQGGSENEASGEDVAYLLESDVWWIFLDTCLTGDHMVLSQSGWRSIRCVEVGELVLSFNVETYEMEWKPVTRVIARKRNTADAGSTLYRMQGGGMDVVATRDHRLLLARMVAGRLSTELPIEFATVGDVLDTGREESDMTRAVLTAGINKQPAIRIVIPGLERVCDWWYDRDRQCRFLHFLGFWLARGRLSLVRHTVIISQRTPSSNTDWLVDVLNDVFPRCWAVDSTCEDAQQVTDHYKVRCPPLYNYLRPMDIGPLGYSPADASSLRNYPHFAVDAELACHEQRWLHHNYQLNKHDKHWTQADMYAALTGSEVWCTCRECGDVTVRCTRDCCAGDFCNVNVGRLSRTHDSSVQPALRTEVSSPTSTSGLHSESDESALAGSSWCDSHSGDRMSDMDDTSEPLLFDGCYHATRDEEGGEGMERAGAIVWQRDGWWIAVDRDWFALKRWLGKQNIADAFSRLSREQAVALLEGACRADVSCGGVQYDKSTGRPQGDWVCTVASFPLVDQLQLVAQLAESTVTLRKQQTASRSTPINVRAEHVSVAQWQLRLSFSESPHTPIPSRPLAQPMDVSNDVAARGHYEYEDDGNVYCIQVQDNANFLTQRLSLRFQQTAAGETLDVAAHPLFIGNCLGLRHLHRCGILHMDLKLDNLLVTADRDARGRVQGRRVLLSDMGNAIIKGDAHQRTGNTGTMQYAAPETLIDAAPQQQQRTESGTSPTAATASSAAFAYSEKSDLWSLGVCLHCLCYSALPYSAETAQQLYATIHSQPLHIPAHPRRSPELVALITALLSVEPQKRPDCEAILNHPHIRRRREERQHSMHQQQQQHRASQRDERSARQMRTEATHSLYTAAANVDDVGTDRPPPLQQQQHSSDAHQAALTLRTAPHSALHANSPLQQHQQQPHHSMEASSSTRYPMQHQSAQTSSVNASRTAKQQTDSTHRVDQPLALHSAARLPSTSPPQQRPPSPVSALFIMRSSSRIHSPRPSQQKQQHAPSPHSLLAPAEQSAGDAVSLVATYDTPEVGESDGGLATAGTPSSAKAFISRPDSAAGVGPSEGSSALSGRCGAALSAVELLGHVCVVSWCAAHVSVVALPLQAAAAPVPLWLLAASLPLSTVALRACLLLPLVVPFSFCTLSLTLSVLLPAELVASLLAAAPSLRRSLLSVSGRVCTAAIMCLYTVLLLAVLSNLS